jgi:hypothetical protein
MEIKIMEGNKLLYEEPTTKRIDDIFTKQRGEKTNQGRLLFYISMITFFLFMIISIILIIYSYDLGSLSFGSLLLLLSTFFCMYQIKFILTLDDLKIYSNGIILPQRTINEYQKGYHHFLAFNEINKIYIDKNFLNDVRVPIKKILIYKKNGTLEKFNPYLFRDINRIENLIRDKVEIVKF